ncbi:MAG: 3-phosphoshikimate 1-carboxyvinyltransferase [Dehalococcoidia bacterium]|jgi:3-phosphoshikimate 1-carboxyvinyltransferase
MRALISKSDIQGTVKAPSSKSYTLRGLICAALAEGTSEITSPLPADDTEAAREVLGKIGVRIKNGKDAWLISGGHFKRPDSDLYCHDSAGTLRFMTAVCSLVPGTCRLTAGPSLAKRPVGPLIEALKQVGVNCGAEGGLAPVMVEGGLKGGLAVLPGDISSQFVSALLFIAPLAPQEMAVKLSSPLESTPYVMMTLDCMKDFGVKIRPGAGLRSFKVARQRYSPARYMVEGDWSSASYPLALGAAAGEAQVNNLNIQSRQADRAMVDLLKRMGADIHTGHDSVTVKKSALKPLKANLSNCIDLLPTIAALCAAAPGVSELSGIERAHIKESDRVAAVKEGLERMGVSVSEGRYSLFIMGGRLKGASIDSKGDHRIAMAFSILGILAGDTIIEGAECVSKTYPEFWDVLKSMGGEVTLDGK